MPGKAIGLFSFMLFILAVMIFWGGLVRINAAKNPDSPFWGGLIHNVG